MATNSTALSPTDFRQSLSEIRRLHSAAQDAAGHFAKAYVKWAQHYAHLHDRLQGDVRRQNELREACGLSEQGIFRVLRVGRNASEMLPFHRQLPSAEESLYEVGRAFEKHPPTVIKALKAGNVTSLADARVVRKLAEINAPQSAKTKKPRRFAGTHLTAGQKRHTPDEFVKRLKKQGFTFLFERRARPDAGTWGKVYRVEILATNVERVKSDKSIPEDVPDKYRALLDNYLPK